MCEGCKWLKPEINVGLQQYMKYTNPNCALFNVIVAYGCGMKCSKMEAENKSTSMDLKTVIKNEWELAEKLIPKSKIIWP